MPPRSFLPRPFTCLEDAARCTLSHLYSEKPPPRAPVTNKSPKKSARNEEICARHAAGETLSDLAKAYGISVQRVWQIVHGNRKQSSGRGQK
ncbi:MAG: LysM peptidoglycan-binding domain-containing protein [Anaerolineae bacterium]|nr:LysM peptidoglycan-binding domain-containing protein [Anaerolineae bacterium]